MPAPITSETICDLVPSSTATVCQRVKSALIEIPQRLCDFFSWMLDSAGNFSEEFKLMVANITHSPGDIKPSVTNVQVPGWELCDGGPLNRTTHSKLFANIGTTFGAGDGLTTFNKPDFRGRGLIGAGQGTGLTSRIVGQQTIGSETHTLTKAELPSATASGDALPTAAGMFVTQQWTLGAQAVGGGDEGDEPYNRVDADAFVNAIYSQLSGNNQGHNNMQPSAVVYWYIFTGKFS